MSHDNFLIQLTFSENPNHLILSAVGFESFSNSCFKGKLFWGHMRRKKSGFFYSDM